MKKPTQTLPENSFRAHQMQSTIFYGAGALIGIAGFFFCDYWNWPLWIPAVVLGLSILCWILDFFWLNRFRWTYFRYDVDERDVVIQKGALFRSSIYVPMIRIQHVDIKTGPIISKYGLAEFRVHTGGSGVFEVAYIPIEEAERLCEQVRQWIKVDEDEIDAKTE
ncbi:PH domain-containing protein [Baia soyae]|uniref:YdbS-like PH domain-containing protein n=1 Tax=Baia soyae TaxID=1544746 RepID=A0A4R2RX49_9BACL|nr:PH domain-containing protein [Baia soyae]TCP69052.1 hypothetical protein EDD57_11435 [Baia soyae]